MSALSLFDIRNDTCQPLQSQLFALEIELHTLIEKHLETLLGVRLLASEYMTDGGRMDTLGLDENGTPVVIEYKRREGLNVVMQGLFYIDWLVKHKAEFTLLVQQRLGMEVASTLNLASPRLICIAGSYSLYELHGVQQIPRPIELLRYHHYPSGLLLLERAGGGEGGAAKPGAPALNKTTASPSSEAGENSAAPPTALDALPKSEPAVQEAYAALEELLMGLGADVVRKPTQTYVAFRKVKNFVCVQVLKGSLALYLRLDPAQFALEPGFSRDVSQIGHVAPGNLELTLRRPEDVERAQALIQQAYDEGL